MALGGGSHSGWDPGRQGGLAWELEETGPKAAGATSCPSARPSLLAAHSCFGPLHRFPSLGFPRPEQVRPEGRPETLSGLGWGGTVVLDVLWGEVGEVGRGGPLGLSETGFFLDLHS